MAFGHASQGISLYKFHTSLNKLPLAYARWYFVMLAYARLIWSLYPQAYSCGFTLAL